MKKIINRLLALTMALLLIFPVGANLASAASVGRVKSLQAYGIDDDEINLKWKKVSGAEGYAVYMYTTKGWVNIGSTKKTSFEADELSSAKQYKFKVRAYDLTNGKKTYGAYSSVLTTATDPDEVESLRVSKKTTTSVTLKWAKVKGATIYQIYIYDAKENKYVYKTYSKDTDATIKKLKPGTTYKFKVRAYFKTDGKKYYGDYSDAISVKTNGTAASSSPSVTYIGTSKAGSIALANAGLNSSQVRGYECKLDNENGIYVYEVEFSYGRYEYEYEINAVTGKIISAEKSRD